jgi:multimeric flavodoxin WrbA
MSDLVVLLCSHRKEGKNTQILEMLAQVKHHVEFVHFAELRFKSCIQCAKCTNGLCKEYVHDGFNALLEKLKHSKRFVIISPLYSPIPSKLSIFLERLTSVTYFSEIHTGGPPLRGKKCAVIGYDSRGVNREVGELIRKILKPNIIGYHKPEDHRHGVFIDDSADRQSHDGDILGYIASVFERIYAEISSMNNVMNNGG